MLLSKIVVQETHSQRVANLPATPVSTKRLLEGANNRPNIVTIPDSLQPSVRKAKDSQILNHFLTEVVVNSIDVFFRKVLTQCTVEFLYKIPITHRGNGVRNKKYMLSIRNHRKQKLTSKLSRSRPKGFSTIRRVQPLSSSCMQVFLMASPVSAKTLGGMAK
jgi:hypothetical protein